MACDGQMYSRREEGDILCMAVRPGCVAVRTHIHRSNEL